MTSVSKGVLNLFHDSVETIKSRLESGNLKGVILERANPLEKSAFLGEIDRFADVTLLDIPSGYYEHPERIAAHIAFEYEQLEINGRPHILVVNSRDNLQLPDSIKNISYSLDVHYFRRQDRYMSNPFHNFS